eukprot:g1849.t1
MPKRKKTNVGKGGGGGGGGRGEDSSKSKVFKVRVEKGLRCLLLRKNNEESSSTRDDQTASAAQRSELYNFQYKKREAIVKITKTQEEASMAIDFPRKGKKEEYLRMIGGVKQDRDCKKHINFVLQYKAKTKSYVLRHLCGVVRNIENDSSVRSRKMAGVKRIDRSSELPTRRKKSTTTTTTKKKKKNSKGDTRSSGSGGAESMGGDKKYGDYDGNDACSGIEDVDGVGDTSAHGANIQSNDGSLSSLSEGVEGVNETVHDENPDPLGTDDELADPDPLGIDDELADPDPLGIDDELADLSSSSSSSEAE